MTLSRKIAGGVARAGAADPRRLAELGLQVVDLSSINDPSNANHSKFADSPAIVQLIGRGMNDGHSLSASGDNAQSLTSIGGTMLKSIVQIPAGTQQGNAGSVVTLGN